MLEIAGQPGLNIIPVKQLARGSGIFGGYQCHLTQHAQSPQRDILKVTYGRGYDI